MTDTNLLNQLLAGTTPQAEHEEAWNDDQRFHVSSYLTQKLPPLEFISSVRVIVLNLRDVLVIYNEDNEEHVVPGGRREAGETLEQTARREVREETGWNLGTLYLLGFWHFRRLTAVLPNYPYPIHFAQAIYTAQPLDYVLDAKLPDDCVTNSGFLSETEAAQLKLSAGERLFLEAAQTLFSVI